MIKKLELIKYLKSIVLILIFFNPFIAFGLIGVESITDNTNRPLKIGIFHGTFDPIHKGHQLIASTAIQEAQLDFLLFIPNDQTTYKPGASSLVDRVHMANILFSDDPRIIIPRIDTEGNMSLHKILHHLKTSHSNIKLIGIIGTDNVFANWAEGLFYLEADKLVDEWLVNRRGSETRDIPQRLQNKPVKEFTSGDGGISSSAVKKLFFQGHFPNEIDSRLRDFIGQKKLYGYRTTSTTIKSCKLLLQN